MSESLARPIDEQELLSVHPNALRFLATLTGTSYTELPSVNQEKASAFIEHIITIHDEVVRQTSQHPTTRGEQVRRYINGASTAEIAGFMGAKVEQPVYAARNRFIKVVTQRGGIAQDVLAESLNKYISDDETTLEELLPLPVLPEAPNRIRPVEPKPKRTRSKRAPKPVPSVQATTENKPSEDSTQEDENKATQETAEEEQLEEEHETYVSTDLVRIYLKEIGRVALLNAEQEVELAKRIEAGLFAVELLRDNDAFQNSKTVQGKLGEGMSEEDLRNSLELLSADGVRAKNHLVEANLRLVVSIAKRYVPKAKTMGFLDLIQEGNIGLNRAVEKFDYTKGYKFSTYATWWIRQALQRAIADQDRTVRVPVHMVEQINKALRIKKDLEDRLSRKATNEEIAEEMEITPDKVEEILSFGRNPISLDQTVGDSKGSRGQTESTFGEFIEDVNAPDAFEAASFKDLQTRLAASLALLSEREKRVMELRFGLADGHPHTLEEIADEFGLTRERIRQIEAKTKAKLRHPAFSKNLRDFLE